MIGLTPFGVTLGGGTFDMADKSESFNLLAGSGTVTDSSATASSLTIGTANGSGTFSGAIRNGNATVSLTQIGTGTLTLSGTSDNASLALDAEAGTTILNKTSSASVHAVSGITNIATGALVQLSRRLSGKCEGGHPVIRAL